VLLLRVVCFALSVLLLTETLQPDWGWYLALWVLCLASLSLLSLAAAFVSFWLMIGLFEPGDAWHTVLSVFTLVSVLQALIRRQTWQWQAITWQSDDTYGGGRWRRWRLTGRD
jgi:hypothetical protein